MFYDIIILSVLFLGTYVGYNTYQTMNRVGISMRYLPTILISIVSNRYKNTDNGELLYVEEDDYDL